MKNPVLLILIAVFLAACQNYEEPLPFADQSASLASRAFQDSDDSLKASYSEIEYVAANYINAESKLSRAENKKQNYKIETIINNGEPAFYVINYDNNAGFVLLSASKALDPILATSSKGNFSVDGIPEQLQGWLDAVSAEASKRETGPTDSLFRTMDRWNTLLGQKSIKKIPSPNYTEEPFATGRELILQAQNAALANGAQIYWGGSQFCDNSSVCNSAWQTAQGNVYPEFEECWYDFCFVAKYTDSSTKTKNNLVNTHWGQECDYNKYYPASVNGGLQPAGCVPVAIGQLMFYHRWPSTYQWNSMSPNIADNYNAKLLYDIAVVAGTDEGGTLSEDPVIPNVLKSFGYNADVHNPDWEYMINEIDNNRPVIIRGIDKTTSIRHAWLGIGYRKEIYKERCEMYYVSSLYQSPYTFTVQNNTTITSNKIYMNWGWYGAYDGYYNVNPTLTNGRNYNILKFVTASPK